MIIMPDFNDITLTLTVSQELMQQIQQKSQETGYTISQLLQEAINQYLTSDNSSDIKLMSRQILDIQRQLLTIEKVPQDLTKVEARVAMLERRMGGATMVTKPQVLSTVDDNEEEFYDEPDEILTDFLPD